MKLLPIIYLAYMFVSLYFLTMFLIIYYRNRNNFFLYPKTTKKYTVSFIIPAYNEAKTIGESLKHIFNLDYPYIEEVIVVNDGSTDDTREVLVELSKKYPRLKVINNEKNYGKAAIAQNKGLNAAKGEIIAIVDADSYPARDSLGKMVGYFDDVKVGAVTCPVVARNRNNFIEKLQAIEYKVIAFSRKLLDYVDAIYVTPGPLALYRKQALLNIGGFDEDNITQDIEATWHLTHDGWNRRMCLATEVSTTVPSKFKKWYVQRRRWNIGGLQCIYKYKRSIFNPKKGMLGLFIVPFFILGTFLGLVGLSIFTYLMTMRLISNFLSTEYTILAQNPIITFDEFYITPNVLNYLGIILFVFGLVFTLIILSILKEKIMIKENLLNIPFYMLVYISFYPFILVDAVWQTVRGNKVWR
jgi:poly-beta-1,6-N-acetyl-D-glucosamine synthase